MEINKGELIFSASDNELFKSAIEISLFSWARADHSYGWFYRDMGSLLWQAFRAKINDDEMRKVEFDARQSLQWLIDDGFTAEIKTFVRRSFDSIVLQIKINEVSYEYTSADFPAD